MKIAIGTRSTPKIIAITRAISRYPELWSEDENNIEYITIPKDLRNGHALGNQKDAFSNVSCNPITMEDTIQGAKNRARNAYEYVLEKYKECNLGIGIEAGLYKIECAQTGYMDHSVCSIYDGEEYYLGFGPSFEYPREVVKRVLNGEEIGVMTDIFGSTAKERKGAIGVLTKERVYRDELEEYAVIMALTKIVSKDMYK